MGFLLYYGVVFIMPKQSPSGIRKKTTYANLEESKITYTIHTKEMFFDRNRNVPAKVNHSCGCLRASVICLSVTLIYRSLSLQSFKFFMSSLSLAGHVRIFVTTLYFFVISQHNNSFFVSIFWQQLDFSGLNCNIYAVCVNVTCDCVSMCSLLCVRSEKNCQYNHA